MSPERKRQTPARRFGLLLAACCLLAASVAAAQAGRFDIRSAASRLQDGVYFLSARVDYRLSEQALEALESGVSLTVELQIQVFRLRRFLPDAEAAELEQSYQLSYQPLSRRYVIRNLNSGEQSTHATLFSALNDMGRVNDLPIIDESLLEPDARYEIRLRAVLDQNTLPGPLRLLAFWGDSFRLESEWYTWSLRD
jgi:hypothetical protein